MKRELLQNVKVQPYTSGDVIDKIGFRSAVIGAVIGTAGALTLTIEHSGDGDEFSTVSDKLVFPEKPTIEGHDGEFTTEELEAGVTVNIDIDLVGLKNFVKITASGAAAASTKLAIVLGDSDVQPV